MTGGDIIPLISLKDSIISANPFQYKFTVNAGSLTKLSYHWDFGDGTQTDGQSTEQHVFADNKIFQVKVIVTNGNASPASGTVEINTSITIVQGDTSVKFQTMEGFGGFGGQQEWWTDGPFTSPSYINDIVNDLGVTIIRDEIPTNFEMVNDNDDPYNTDLTKFNINTPVAGSHQTLSAHIQFMKDAKAAGVKTFVVAVWSPPAWMKTNNNTNGKAASTPVYSDSPDSGNNQLKKSDYEEFAEMCVAYVKIIKQQTGIDIYALNVQNEPRFSEPYESCVYNGAAFRDLVKTVGDRFKYEGLTTKIFAPEDIGYLEGVSSMVQPLLDDPISRNYTDIIAVHGYALDGVTANSPDAQTWKSMFGWGAQYGKPLWMTETSGYSNDWKGAMDLSKAIYTAIKQGNVSAWLYWTISTQTLDSYSLMNAAGAKSKRYYTSKNFYRWIRPGAVRFSFETVPADASNIYPLAFYNSALQSTSIVIINDNTDSRAVKLSGNGLPASYEFYVTSSDVNYNCADKGVVNAIDNLVIPAKSIVTLVSK
jgi:glucuronoarabinoxylan endo-1,4-beta-xylanase